MKVKMTVVETIRHKVTAEIDEITYKQLQKNNSISDEIAGDYTNGRVTMIDGDYELEDMETL